MAEKYRQLIYEDRVVAYRLWKLGVPQASIAGVLKVHRSTISREFNWLTAHIGAVARSSFRIDDTS